MKRSVTAQTDSARASMRSFKCPNAYFKFARRVLTANRYLLDAESREFLDLLLEQAADPGRQQVIPVGAFFWRAQLGSQFIDDDENPQVFGLPPERMKPPPGRAKEGRANPKGIPYLYLAAEKETAMAELRPWIGADISLGQFKLTRDVRIAHCWIQEHQRARLFIDSGVPPEDWDKSVWEDIDRAFSWPIVQTDDAADYAPTQIVAELFKTNGYDGIAYRSGVRKGGHNLVLFDPAAAKLHNCAVYDLRDITFEFHQSTNPYFCGESDETLK